MFETFCLIAIRQASAWDCHSERNIDHSSCLLPPSSDLCKTLPVYEMAKDTHSHLRGLTLLVLYPLGCIKCSTAIAGDRNHLSLPWCPKWSLTPRALRSPRSPLALRGHLRCFFSLKSSSPSSQYQQLHQEHVWHGLGLRPVRWRWPWAMIKTMGKRWKLFWKGRKGHTVHSE